MEKQRTSAVRHGLWDQTWNQLGEKGIWSDGLRVICHSKPVATTGSGPSYQLGYPRWATIAHLEVQIPRTVIWVMSKVSSTSDEGHRSLPYITLWEDKHFFCWLTVQQESVHSCLVYHTFTMWRPEYMKSKPTQHFKPDTKSPTTPPPLASWLFQQERFCVIVIILLVCAETDVILNYFKCSLDQHWQVEFQKELPCFSDISAQASVTRFLSIYA